MYSYLTKSIEKGYAPVTEADFRSLFADLGLMKGDLVLVHASLSALGYVVAGAEAIFKALQEQVGTEGTIVVPSQTVEISDPSSWQYPAVPSEWFESIRENMPAYDRKTSFSKSMGQFSNYIGRLPQAARSDHPMYSFTAIGKQAEAIVEIDGLDFPFGENSVLSKLYDAKAKIVMIGTDFETNTSLHLAEHSVGRDAIVERSKILRYGEATWCEFKNIDFDLYDDFLEIQSQFFEKYPPKQGNINDGKVYCFNMVDCVDFAKKHFQKKSRVEV
ncbi:AAC(3) family N-acetyltransferase [Streptococcus danieliae]|uniref:Aminoglycoside N(3)-acetyltransferase n=1 Tax=Streptococcus danieliae TaxID=747656 RepID=A0A7Z0RR58_9STRE|nr:AAC(3) family N-acetyltransferase [Streptococcus danieliae]MBF0717740.1 AAC(3) family N-acetyltransferase [Streptococcus danieliae]NYS49670.1 AAC(3) family N-acetyltransferase [Streptococcus danieliae]